LDVEIISRPYIPSQNGIINMIKTTRSTQPNNDLDKFLKELTTIVDDDWLQTAVEEMKNLQRETIYMVANALEEIGEVK